MARRFLLLVAVGSLLACGKDEPVRPAAGNALYLSFLAVSVDSAFIMAPNVVTPNADGINDLFSVIGTNVSSMHTKVLNGSGVPVFTSDDLTPVWSDIGPNDVGRYRVFVHAISLSGVELAAFSNLHVLAYGPEACISFTGTPVTPDQLDPRVFGTAGPSNDIFCP